MKRSFEIVANNGPSTREELIRTRSVRVRVVQSFQKGSIKRVSEDCRLRELHERITRAIAESGFYLSEIKTTGL